MFGLTITCPDCAGPLRWVNARATGFVSLAILECEPCEWQYEVLARIEKHGRTEAHAERARRAKQAAKVREREKVLAGVAR